MPKIEERHSTTRIDTYRTNRQARLICIVQTDTQTEKTAVHCTDIQERNTLYKQTSRQTRQECTVQTDKQTYKTGIHITNRQDRNTPYKQTYKTRIHHTNR